jgi:glyoxylase-like metal-dependent hydrolase (beta-lactamase superfamily II)
MFRAKHRAFHAATLRRPRLSRRARSATAQLRDPWSPRAAIAHDIRRDGRFGDGAALAQLPVVPTIEIEAFFDSATSTLTYLVYDPATRDGVAIDPVLDFDAASGKVAFDSVAKLIARIRALGLTLHYSLETHAHADHMSGAHWLARECGARIAISERITQVQALFKPIFGLPASFATDGSQFDCLLADGDVLRAGSLAITVLATPGHTPACVSFVIADAVFTGDALFIEDSGTGRCDFPQGDAAELYHSVHEVLYGLPPATRVFVGHDYQPGGRALRFETTIADERARNIQLTATTTVDDFVAFRTKRDRTLQAPKLLLPSVQVNIDAGRLPTEEPCGRRFLRIPLAVEPHLDSVIA